MHIRPLSDACGAEITEIDLRHAADAATVATLEQAWHDHLVIVVRDQELDEKEQLDFASRFGRVGSRTRPKERCQNAPCKPYPCSKNITHGTSSMA